MGWSDTCVDFGCGTEELGKLFTNDHAGNYRGIDISDEAVRVAHDDRVSVGDVYKEVVSTPSEQVYAFLEVLEHINDLQALCGIPSGKRIIFSVPSFDDPGHLRVFRDVGQVGMRYGGVLDILRVVIFLWDDVLRKWRSDIQPTNNRIFLADAIKV